ncbi:MAG: outer membrane protein assembly factor BamB [Gammaproteobacteria bacterium]|nr:outer membrane protein assembly factor BamB [Gammaproteobacteria bacterium]
MKRFLVIIFISTLTSGCTWITSYFSGDDNSTPPSKLTELKGKVNVEKIWSVSIGKGSGEQLLRLIPVIEDEKIYVASRDGNILSFTLGTGKQVWKTETKNKISAGPGVGLGVVVVGTRKAEVVAYDSSTGKQIWLTKVSSEVLSVPQISLNTVVVRTTDGRVTAMDLKQGKILWEFQKREPSLTLRGTSKPVISSGYVISGFDNGQLVSINLKSGRQNWQRKVGIPKGRTELQRIIDLDADPVISNGVIYIAAFQGNIAAISERDGDVIWRRKISLFAGLTVKDENIYLTDATDQVWSLHTRNGASLWRQDALLWRSLTAPVAWGKYIVVADFEGYLHFLDQKDGHQVSRIQADSSGIQVSPIVKGNILVSLGKSGEMIAYKITN